MAKRESLMRWATAIDLKLGELEESVRDWWNEGLASWPTAEQPLTKQVVVERALEPAEVERIERANRLAAMMTKGRWR